MAGAARALPLEQLAPEMRAQAQLFLNGSHKEPLQVCLVLSKAAVRKNFSGSHEPDGAAWRPLVMPRARGGTKGPLRDTDVMMASVTSAGAGQVEDHLMILSSNLDRAPLHQFGGTVTPHGHPFLAIPRTPEALRAGSPRRFGRPLIFVGTSNRSAVLIETKKRRGKKTGEYGRKKLLGVLQFLLLRSVTIPARPFLGFGKKLINDIEHVFGKYLDDFARRGR